MPAARRGSGGLAGKHHGQYNHGLMKDIPGKGGVTMYRPNPADRVAIFIDGEFTTCGFVASVVAWPDLAEIAAWYFSFSFAICSAVS